MKKIAFCNFCNVCEYHWMRCFLIAVQYSQSTIVDRYLKSMGEDTVCVQDGFDSVLP